MVWIQAWSMRRIRCSSSFVTACLALSIAYSALFRAPESFFPWGCKSVAGSLGRLHIRAHPSRPFHALPTGRMRGGGVCLSRSSPKTKPQATSEIPPSSDSPQSPEPTQLSQSAQSPQLQSFHSPHPPHSQGLEKTGTHQGKSNQVESHRVKSHERKTIGSTSGKSSGDASVSDVDDNNTIENLATVESVDDVDSTDDTVNDAFGDYDKYNRHLRDFVLMLNGRNALKVNVSVAMQMADDKINRLKEYSKRREMKSVVRSSGDKLREALGQLDGSMREAQGEVRGSLKGMEVGKKAGLGLAVEAALETETETDPVPPPDPSTFPSYKTRDYFKFHVIHKSQKPGSRARVGRIHTPHGIIDTPGFVPVGTNGAVKAVDNHQSNTTGTQLMFCNTYHLLVHPGADIVENAGGLHKFMNRSGPIITDSGGFQVFSLAEPTEEDGDELKSRGAKRLSKSMTSGPRGGSGSGSGSGSASLLSTTEEGVKFRSYFDGSEITLTPESSVRAQKKLASDIIVPLDELPAYHVSKQRLKESVYLSHRWEARSLLEHLANPQQQAMYAVIHGGVDRDLRKLSVEYLSQLPFDGFAVGGSLGKDRKEMANLLEFVMPLLPEDKPNHILGIADMESVESTVAFGCDTFDSAYPTRLARHGSLFTTEGVIHIKLTRFKDDHRPIDPKCPTIPYTRAYLHHLMRQKEPLFLTLASMHNMAFMNNLMATIREKILNNEI